MGSRLFYFMKNKIHFNQEEKLANNTEQTVSAINENAKKIEENTKAVKDKSVEIAGFTGLVKAQNNTIKKLDEVKSAALITNQELKKVTKGIKVEIEGVKVITMKGDDGKQGTKGEKGIKGVKGDKGEKGEKGDQGEKGNQGVQGTPGPKGDKGEIGTQGERGSDGEKGQDGKNGSPDSPEEIVDKVNTSNNKILWKQIKDVPDFSTLDTMNQVGYASGGANQLRFLSNGVVVSAFVTEINFSTNITPVYDGNGRITLTATGGAGTTTYSETPSGTINGSNVTFTTLHTITTVINFAINGQFIHPAEYSVAGTTITFVTAPDASLSGLSFTIIYQ